MTQQFYVSPEQLMKDRADFARKGIARGKSVVVISCEDGIALVAENPSPSLHKIGEIYDKIAFAAVGKYNEFESLRQAGVRYADVRGYSYDREDVTARGLASVYAQSLGAVFTAEQKPFEVELAVAEVGATQAEDHLYRLTFDGSIADEHSFVVMGGQADRVASAIDQGWRASLGFPDAVRLALNGLAPAPETEETAKPVPARAIEVAVLDRHSEEVRGARRAFRRLNDADITALLA
ncbi:20S proteasome A and B subunits [Pseudarthrobacter chlorophenolicus A6]|uniref:Proteasome subunit alpha n=1 Tax=Pseudarthrobacter chlorophenolicus (strain ATCC 700700 / DSM 12829 / CIP 107037 / JCM 12360 / KCTC 9906 / NCIMB 13794 / A6) TaxID=452863 RepID=PSA_PSECP|nr:proteasome subunit alpha [Pseudarthrobacter chlorophenolicus]B8H8L7.1 RecName: Full=Proteasome subunit alpha; AltName: Full=20S proteasome alpha subunit; AltName: Full=Proteasome core protein PrcA [Pseudarthrobacter chlorophenolicus A6]ACL39895.1 20S proteasome A and B subunits [Pseudarthrobacter chlorophenolicus A6]SDQ91757.1 proteasome alpha subunit [Pseudarthrobacter chlorophenolicus]